MYVDDSLSNFVAGIGTQKDKVSGARFGYRLLDAAEVDAMYAADWIAATIIDAPCDDMTREWREWKAGPRQTAAIEAEERRLGLRHKVNQALKLARKDGGAALLLGMGDERPGDPLDLSRVGKRGLRYVHVLSRLEINAGPLERNPLSDFYGEPASYTIAAGSAAAVEVHPSRVVRLIGIPRLSLYGAIDAWGYSVLQRVYDAVRNAASVTGNLGSLTHEAKVDVFRIKGLTQNIGDPQYRERLLMRFGLANTAKSINNALVLDADEVWEQKKIAFGGFPEMIRQYIEIAAGAGQMPVTRLLGTSPGGLNNNNDGALRHFYDTLSSRQEIELRPALARLDEVLIRSALGTNPDAVWYEFRPLWQLTAAEIAETGLKKAQTLKIHAELGIMSPEAMREAARSQISEDGLYPGLDGILERRVGEAAAPLLVAKPTPPPAKPLLLAAPGGVTADAAPHTLYVSRKVENAAEILRWAKAQGFGETLTADDLHVTIAYSREPVDWFAVGTAEDKIVVPRGGPRQMERFGDATVLLFSDWSVRWRHETLREAGCSWDHPEYQPHITIAYGADVPALGDTEPYQGRIVLGPEIFAEVDDGWKVKVTS